MGEVDPSPLEEAVCQLLSGQSCSPLGAKGKCPRASLPLLSLKEVLQESNCLPNTVKSSAKTLFLLL